MKMDYEDSPSLDSSTSSPKNGSPMSPTNLPALPTSVHLGLTITYIVLYSFLFLFVYVQLILILWYRHKRFSYQTSFLFLCLIWAALRTTLFSFYFKNPVLANNLTTFLFWLLYCFPVCLQFVTLCLLVLYFSQVMFNAKAKYEPNTCGTCLRLALALAVIIFLTTNIASAVVSQRVENKTRQPHELVTTRVLINEFLFLACGSSLAVCVYKLTKMTSAKVILETRGITVCQMTVACMITILLYISRASYNLVVLFLSQHSGAPSFNFGWINVTDQGDIEGFSYAMFGVVLFVWEFLPTFVVVLFFRVQQPMLLLGSESSNGCTARTYFFDNPRRYDSDDELFKHVAASHDSPLRNSEARITRNMRFPTPYGSFLSNYIIHHGSLGRSSLEGSAGTRIGGSHQERGQFREPHPIPTTQATVIAASYVLLC